MANYTFYETKSKLMCEYVDKYNKLYIYEDLDALERLNKVSKYKYNKVAKDDDAIEFQKDSFKVTIENYEYILKKYKLSRLSSLIIKQDILNKVSHLVTPSKIFILYFPTILVGIKLLNLPDTPTLYAERINNLDEITDFIDVDEQDAIEDIETHSNINTDSNISYTNTYNIDIDCYDKGDSSDTQYVLDNYGDIIEELSNRYGFSPNLITGMVTQESHGIDKNLMKVTFSENDDYISKRYNFESNKYETIVLTNSPEEYPDVDIIITEEMMESPYYAVLAGINVLRINFDEYSNNNLCSAVCMYNKGYGNWMGVLKNTSRSTGISIENILFNPNDLSYVPFDDDLKVGDPKYLENVMQYVPDAFENGIYVKTFDNEGNIGMIKLNVNKTLGKVKNK